MSNSCVIICEHKTSQKQCPPRKQKICTATKTVTAAQSGDYNIQDMLPVACGANDKGTWTSETEKSDSQTGCSKYHIWYQKYPVNKGPTIYRLLLVEVLPNSNSKHIIPMRCSVRTPFLVWQYASQTWRGNQEISMKQKMKNHSGAQHILQICCAHPKTTKYGNW